jgi:uncharacterized protein (DUF1778 family)
MITVVCKLSSRRAQGSVGRHDLRQLALYGRCVYNAAMTRVTERWDFRVEPGTDRLVRQAAATSQRTLTDFVVDAAVLEAERLLADRTEFALPPNQWQQFVELLDRSPRDNPGLEKLFSQPSVFSGR